MPTVAERLADGAEYVRRKIYAHEDAIVRQEYDLYRAALDDMLRDLNTLWAQQVDGPTWGGSPQDIAIRNALISQIMRRMEVLDAESAALILQGMIEAYDAGLYGMGWTLDNAVRDAFVNPLTVPIIPFEAVRAQLLQPYVGKLFGEYFSDNRAEFELRIRRALVQSQLQGEGIGDVQRRIRDELGIVTDRRLKKDRIAHRRNFNRTQMIARSEILRASNLGSLAVLEANADVLEGWEWLTTNDDRTCPICAPLDGVVFNFDNERLDGQGAGEAQVPPPAHVQCRCTTLPALLDKALQDRIAPPRQTFYRWAEAQGISENRYGQVFGRPGRDAPQLKKAS